jgi:lysophospholipase L1-like esterase
MEEINILCFGDSLTAGYSDYGMTNTPYGPWMVDLLEGAWPERVVHISVAGQSGDLVGPPGRFLNRLTKKCT